MDLKQTDSRFHFGMRLGTPASGLVINPLWRKGVSPPARAAGEVPMYLETEKGDRDGELLDVISLRTLRLVADG